MIFVDTGAWYASLVPTDPDHTTAAQWLAANRSRLLTTDYVIDETLTLLRARGERKRALMLGARFFNHGLAEKHTSRAVILHGRGLELAETIVFQIPPVSHRAEFEAAGHHRG